MSMMCLFVLYFMSGCSENESSKAMISILRMAEEIETTSQNVFPTNGSNDTESNDAKSDDPKPIVPIITVEDWSEYFEGLNGAAVFFAPQKNQYIIYNKKLANERRSPCSTFKIISSLIGLEKGIIVPWDSTRTWSGEEFWNPAWNQDIDFEEAFRSSCVWYYRKVIDDIGTVMMQRELEQLQYGNCDISDWEGRLNTNNQNRALTGFWIESSLKISPMEQVLVLNRIFGEETVYKPETIQKLKQVMLLADSQTKFPVYGKTGMGKLAGIVEDAWFTGFAGEEGDLLYFCVYLGKTDGADVSSARAKDIALKLCSQISDE